MPAFVKTEKDEKLWSEAKDAAGKSYEKGSDAYWAVANKIFHSMKKSAADSVQKLLFNYSR